MPHTPFPLTYHSDSVVFFFCFFLLQALLNVSIQIDNLVFKLVEGRAVASVALRGLSAESAHLNTHLDTEGGTEGGDDALGGGALGGGALGGGALGGGALDAIGGGGQSGSEGRLRWRKGLVELEGASKRLRKLISAEEVTICLDEQTSDGRVDTFEQPLLRRFSVLARVEAHLQPAHRSDEAPTLLVDVISPKLQVSVSERQVRLSPPFPHISHPVSPICQKSILFFPFFQLELLGEVAEAIRTRQVSHTPMFTRCVTPICPHSPQPIRLARVSPWITASLFRCFVLCF